MTILSIDIGGTNIKSGVFVNNELTKTFKTKTNGKLGLDYIKSGIDEVYKYFKNDYKIEIITISTAGDIDYKNGKCVYASDNLKGFTGFNIKKYIEEKYLTKCLVNNDAVCHLLGILNEENLNKNIFMITLGTGVGAVLYKDHEIYYGNNFDLGRFAHYELVKNGLRCDCGKKGCAEKELSISYLDKAIFEKYHYEMSIKNLFSLYKENDKRAIEILNIYFAKLNKYLKFIESLGVDLIYISGGIASSKDVFMDYIKLDKVRYINENEFLGIYGAKKLIEFYGQY